MIKEFMPSGRLSKCTGKGKEWFRGRLTAVEMLIKNIGATTKTVNQNG